MSRSRPDTPPTGELASRPTMTDAGLSSSRRARRGSGNGSSASPASAFAAPVDGGAGHPDPAPPVGLTATPTSRFERRARVQQEARAAAAAAAAAMQDESNPNSGRAKDGEDASPLLRGVSEPPDATGGDEEARWRKEEEDAIAELLAANEAAQRERERLLEIDPAMNMQPQWASRLTDLALMTDASAFAYNSTLCVCSSAPHSDSLLSSLHPLRLFAARCCERCMHRGKVAPTAFERLAARLHNELDGARGVQQDLVRLMHRNGSMDAVGAQAIQETVPETGPTVPVGVKDTAYARVFPDLCRHMDAEEVHRAQAPPWVRPALPQAERLVASLTAALQSVTQAHDVVAAALHRQQQTGLAASLTAVDAQAVETNRLLSDDCRVESAGGGAEALAGEDGAAVSDTAAASSNVHQLQISRRLLSDSCRGVGISDAPHDIQCPGAGAALYARTAAREGVPLVHADFLEDEHEKVDMSVLLPAGYKQNPTFIDRVGASGDPGSQTGGALRTISVSLGAIRFREHPQFSSEHQVASILLDAYTQYQLLTQNMLPGLHSRHFYDTVVEQLDRTLMRLQRVGGMRSSGVGSLRLAAAGPATEEALVADELNAAREKQTMAAEIELTALQTMWRAWRELRAIWAKVEDGKPRSVFLDLAFVRRDDPEQATFTEATDPRTLLDYVPRLVVAEPPAITAALQAQPVKASKVLKTVPPTNAAQHVSSQSDVYVLRVLVKTGDATGLQLVDETEPRTLDSTFTATFNETFEIQLLREPQAIVVQLCTWPQRVVLSEVTVPPALSRAAHALTFRTGEKFAGEGDIVKSVGGVVTLSTTWTTMNGMTIEQIERLFLEGELDPLDPRNSELATALRRHYQQRRSRFVGSVAEDGEDDEALVPKPYPSRPDSAEMARRAGCESDSIVRPRPIITDDRLLLLQRRWALEAGLDAPVDEVERRMLLELPVPSTAMAVRRVERLVRNQIDDERQEQFSHRATHARDGVANAGVQGWRMRLREKRYLKAFKARSDGERLSQVMTVPPNPTFGALLQRVKMWFVPTRGLNPSREMRPHVSDIDIAQLKDRHGASNFVVHVMKASHLPLRDDGSSPEVFAEARFVGASSRTLSQPGPSPSWFETLTVPFTPDAFDEGTLSLIDDDLQLDLFDEIRVPLPPDRNQGDSTAVTHFRTERRFLGCVKIPFYSIYNTERASVEGEFTLQVPRWVMGYHTTADNNLPARPPTVHVYFSLWPPLCAKHAAPEPLAQRLRMTLTSAELNKLNFHALQWEESIRKVVDQVITMNPVAGKRPLCPFVTNSRDDPVLMCGYISPQGLAPPPGVTTVAEAIRFVALIPFVVDVLTSEGDDVWSTYIEFLEALAGDYEEHALLALALIRHLAPNDPSFLVIGRGQIYTEAAFVLFALNGSWRLLDPRTGNLHELSDASCELSEVGMVVSHNQVWANTQVSGVPSRMLWDLDDARCWTPMFPPQLSDAVRTHLQPIQPPSVPWERLLGGSSRSRDATMKMEDEIRRAVKNALRVWRGDRSVTFQERVSFLLRDALVCLEDERRVNANVRHPIVEESHRAALREFELEYVVVGCPVHVSITRALDSSSETPINAELLAPLIAALRETAIHEVGGVGTKFAVATHVRPYAPALLSVWVYVVALKHRN